MFAKAWSSWTQVSGGLAIAVITTLPFELAELPALYDLLADECTPGSFS